mmetsp:Transcript_18552/g.39845  ORF Transcript_18552/g.39845 Transcript_18552/m.39845 type:complete len:310 (+) Transcript_18552:93-1022(+)|eukprot:CAMPEP_0172551090 /NCGR_PEP_ID=MMETSP1067-20121228/36486_1 /TAXON_ID=265564 ORGANISM="Thalassiosira punctigera, Strain Tpunct2005C2" /NCGR_SAMPLE_ID=MMETSP1067 /ASSEMBLY_ACC=CAM_ASM_000444 /LENGTH=309 /DNA_ID=CAMNT_0013338829 /DNA_START=70 /DNA_END=999 /DNA_ORIENTATION=+
MRNCIISLTAISGLSGAAAWSGQRGSRRGAVAVPPSFVLSIRGGADEYETKFEGVKCSVIEKASRKIEEARRKIVDECSAIPDFGCKADEICAAAIEEFSKSAPLEPDGPSASAAYARKLAELESSLDAPLQVLYLRQLALLRDKALASYKAASKASDASDYEAMLAADAQFLREAEGATRGSSDWTYDAERAALQSIMSDFASTSKKLAETQVQSSQQQSTAMQFLQHQQQMIQQLQMQLYGQSSPWNVGVAYRIPDTNFNLQGSYQQGRANLQLSCVPDEYAPMLGPNGFTNGVGPGNLGLSLNLSI